MARNNPFGILITAYERLPAKTIRAEIKDAIKVCEKWFVEHPERRIANIMTWQGLITKVHRGSIEKDVRAAAETVIKMNAQAHPKSTYVCTLERARRR